MWFQNMFVIIENRTWFLVADLTFIEECQGRIQGGHRVPGTPLKFKAKTSNRWCSV